MTLTVRSASVTGATTAARALTHAEMDANWAHVIQSANQNFLPSGTGAVARTTQAKERDIVSFADFGANGDGTTLNDTAWTNFIAALTSVGGIGYIPAPAVGYAISASLTIAARSRLKLFGPAPSGNLLGAQFIWNGSNGGTGMICDRVRDSLFEDFSIVPGSGTLAIGLRVDHVSAPSGNTLSTNNIFKRIGIGACSTTNVRVGNSSTSNNDLHKFEDCYLAGGGTNGLEINNGQSKSIRFDGGSIGSCVQGITVTAGSFHSRGTNFSANTTDVYLGSPTDNISILSAQSETANKFLDDSGNDSTAWCVTVEACRLDPNNIGGDNIYMRFRKGGPLVLLNNDFASGTYRAAIRWFFDSAAPGVTVVSIGNIYPNATPFTTGLTQNLASLEDRCLTAASTPAVLNHLYLGGLVDLSASAAGQIKYPATQNASSNLNTLDDYQEKDTWTPTDTSGAALALTVGTCEAIKIGKDVKAEFNITYPVTADASAAQIGSLPWTSGNITSAWGGFVTYTNAGVAFSIVVAGNTTNMQFYDNAGVAKTNANLSGKIIRGVVIYKAAA